MLAAHHTLVGCLAAARRCGYGARRCRSQAEQPGRNVHSAAAGTLAAVTVSQFAAKPPRSAEHPRRQCSGIPPGAEEPGCHHTTSVAGEYARRVRPPSTQHASQALYPLRTPVSVHPRKLSVVWHAGRSWAKGFLGLFGESTERPLSPIARRSTMMGGSRTRTPISMAASYPWLRSVMNVVCLSIVAQGSLPLQARQ